MKATRIAATVALAMVVGALCGCSKNPVAPSNLQPVQPATVAAGPAPTDPGDIGVIKPTHRGQ